MTVYNISGIGSFDYEALLEKKAGGTALTTTEQSFLLAFGDKVLSGVINLTDANSLSDQEILNLMTKFGGSLTDKTGDGKFDTKDVLLVAMNTADGASRIYDTNGDGKIDREDYKLNFLGQNLTYDYLTSADAAKKAGVSFRVVAKDGSIWVASASELPAGTDANGDYYNAQTKQTEHYVVAVGFNNDHAFQQGLMSGDLSVQIGTTMELVGVNDSGFTTKTVWINADLGDSEFFSTELAPNIIKPPKTQFAYQPEKTTTDENQFCTQLLRSGKHDLSDNELKLILKFIYSNTATDGKNLMQDSSMANMSEADYLAVMKIFKANGADASEIQRNMVNWIMTSVEQGAPQCLNLKDSSVHQVQIGNVLYNISTKSGENTTVIWSKDPNGQITFFGSDLIIADGSADGSQNDNIKVVGDNNKVSLGNGTNVGYVLGDMNSLLGGDGVDILEAEGKKNYLDAGKGNDSVYIAGESNVAFGMLGDDNFFLKGKTNVVNAGDGSDKVYDDSTSAVKKNIEAVLASALNAPEFFKKYTGIDVEIPPDVEDPTKTSVILATGEEVDDDFQLQSNVSHDFSALVDTELNSYTVSSPTAQGVQYNIDNQGNVTLKGDNLKLKDVSDDEFKRLTLLTSNGTELMKQPTGEKISLNANETKLLAVKVGNTVYTVQIRNIGSTPMSDISCIVGSDGKIDFKSDSDLNNLSITVVSKDPSVTVQTNGKDAFNKNTAPADAGSTVPISVTIGDHSYTFNIKNTGNAQEIIYYVDNSNKVIIEGSGLEIEVPSDLPATSGVNIIGSGNTASSDEALFNGVEPHKFTADGLKLTNVSVGQHEYNFSFGGKTYLLELNVQQAGDITVHMDASGNLVLDAADADKVSVLDTSKLPTATKPIVEEVTALAARGTTQISISVGGTSYTYDITSLGERAQDIKLYVDANGQIVIVGNDVKIGGASFPANGLNVNGVGNVSNNDNVKFNGHKAVQLDETGSLVNISDAGTYEYHFAFGGQTYLLNFTTNEATDVVFSMDDKGNVSMTAPAGVVTLLKSILPDGASFNIEEIHTTPTLTTGNLTPISITVKGKTYTFEVNKRDANSDDTLSYVIQGDSIVFMGNGLQIKNTTAASADDALIIALIGDNNGLEGSITPEHIVVTGNGNIISGNGGDDVIDVKGDNNSAFGGEGNDDITVKGEGSIINGSEGNDKITLNGSNGQVYGDAGDDDITVDGHGNTISGGDGIDKFTGDVVTNTINPDTDNYTGFGAVALSATPQPISITVDGKAHTFDVSSSVAGSVLKWEIASDGEITFIGNGATVTATSNDDSKVKLAGNSIAYNAGSGMNVIEFADGASDCRVTGAGGSDMVVGNVVGNYVNSAVEFVNYVPISNAVISQAFADFAGFTADQQKMWDIAAKMGTPTSFSGTLTLGAATDGFQQITASSLTGVTVSNPIDDGFLWEGVTADISFDDSGVPVFADINGSEADGSIYSFTKKVKADDQNQYYISGIQTAYNGVSLNTPVEGQTTYVDFEKTSDTTAKSIQIVKDSSGNIISRKVVDYTAPEGVSGEDFDPFCTVSLEMKVVEKNYDAAGKLVSASINGIAATFLSNDKQTVTVPAGASVVPVVIDGEVYPIGVNNSSTTDTTATVRVITGSIAIQGAGLSGNAATTMLPNGTISQVFGTSYGMGPEQLYSTLVTAAAGLGIKVSNSHGFTAANLAALYNSNAVTPAIKTLLELFTDGKNPTATFNAACYYTSFRSYDNISLSRMKKLFTISQADKGSGNRGGDTDLVVESNITPATIKHVLNKTEYLSKYGKDNKKMDRTAFQTAFGSDAAAVLFNADGSVNTVIAAAMRITVSGKSIIMTPDLYTRYGSDMKAALDIANYIEQFDTTDGAKDGKLFIGTGLGAGYESYFEHLNIRNALANDCNSDAEAALYLALTDTAFMNGLTGSNGPAWYYSSGSYSGGIRKPWFCDARAFIDAAMEKYYNNLA